MEKMHYNGAVINIERARQAEIIANFLKVSAHYLNADCLKNGEIQDQTIFWERKNVKKNKTLQN